jgi:hypothetical protein
VGGREVWKRGGCGEARVCIGGTGEEESEYSVTAHSTQREEYQVEAG